MRRTFPITGIGCLSAAGIGTQQTIDTFFEGFIPQVLSPSINPYFKLELKESWFSKFNYLQEDFLPNLLMWVAVDEALESAQLSPADLRKFRVGVSLGTTVACTNHNEKFSNDYNLGIHPDPKPLYGFFKNNCSQMLSRRYQLNGPILALNNACTSGADAIGVAQDWLDQNRCDIVICGGVEQILDKIFYGFRSLQLCSPTFCKPFDRDRQGLTLGDGAGILILEKPEISRARSKKPLAHLCSYGSASDALHPTSPDENAMGMRRAVEFSLKQAGVNPSQVGFINAHATATPHNDMAEGKLIKSIFPNSITVGTKGYTGHTLGAAGGLEAVFTVLSLIKEKLPATKGFETIDPAIGMIPTTETTKLETQYAISLSLGFGGTNAALLFQKETQ
jgi:3-oxoacyl-[acyl-carrier-protein] synthase II